MPSFPKPKTPNAYNLATEIQNLRAHKAVRAVPAKSANTVLVGTWNIANLGAQGRRPDDLALIAEILSWFDVAAIQECRENYGQLADMVRTMKTPYRYLFSDAAGNNERMSFVYDSAKLPLLEEIGEIAFPPSQLPKVKYSNLPTTFQGWDRNPYFASFQASGTFAFTLCNVHLFYGGTDKASIQRRTLETYALAIWASRRQKSTASFTRELIALGDFNMPKRDPSDPIFAALTKLGLVVPDHSSIAGSNLEDDADYDEMALFPETKTHFTGLHGIFDYDTAIWPALWAQVSQGQTPQKARNAFEVYLRYYISDHRPMWMQLSV